MTPEEYFRQRKEEGDREWARLLAMAECGEQPSNAAVADALFQYGLEPASEAARFVALRMVGEIPPPETRGRKPKRRPDDESLRWLYQRNLETLQALQESNRTKYSEEHGSAPPYQVATEKLAKEWGVGVRVIEKLRKDSGG